MKGFDYLNHFMLPNFYFHLTAAYAIVRNFGVDLGKREFSRLNSAETKLDESKRKPAPG